MSPKLPSDLFSSSELGDSAQPKQAEIAQSIEFSTLQPAVASMAIEPPAKPRVVSCYFERTQRPLRDPKPRVPNTNEPSVQKEPRQNATSKRTRVRPPADVVRLSDRLDYLLQPPLESLVRAESLRFPFTPFPFQMDGIAFLYPRRRAVVADEMGLGKTMQTISSMRLLAHSGQLQRALIVCPKPLISNWKRELAQWAPELGVTVVSGPPSRRGWLWSQTQSPVSIVSYETALRDQHLLHDPSRIYDLVVLDEAQRIKNKSGAANLAMRKIPRQRSWALTGTPIENKIDDLVGIYEFVSPQLIDSDMRPPQIASAVRDSVLRRTKDKVLDQLPPKLVQDTSIDLSPEQIVAYQQAEKEGVFQLKQQEGGLTEIPLRHVFQLVLRLKQICNFDPTTGASTKADRLEADLEECAQSGRKAIVFSQWVDTIDRLEAKLQRFSPECFHGRMTTPKREAALDRFRNDPECDVLLMSYGAGSVGLNLQFAGYVFLFDRWWNPAVEDQAINRAHRIGASGPVTVSRFLCSGTIEERIDAILRDKRELFAKVFQEGAQPPSKGLTRDDLLSLFDLRSPEGSLRAAA